MDPRYALVLFSFLLTGARVNATCASPCSPAGKFQYTSSDFVYCDGCTWNTMNVSNTGTACSTSGMLKSTGTDVQYCSSTTGKWTSAVGTQTNGACSLDGAIQWDGSNAWMAWCNGGTWKVLQSASGPAFVQKVEVLTAACTNCQTGAFGSSTTTGNLMVCGVSSGHGAYATAVDDTAGNSYTRIGTLPGSGSGWRTELWYKENLTGGSSFKVTAHFSGSADTAITCAEYSGIQTASSFDQFVSKSCSTTSCAVGPTPTSTTAKELVVFYAGSADNNSAGAGYTKRSTTVGSTIGDKVGNTIGTYSSTPSGSNAGWDVFLATFRSK